MSKAPCAPHAIYIPPLYYWLLHLWIRLTGSSEFAIRSLSVFAGLVTAALVWSLTLRLSGRKIAAALALLLITLSPFHIHWSQETRMYALAAMFAALAAYACWRGWTGLLILGGNRGVA